MAGTGSRLVTIGAATAGLLLVAFAAVASAPSRPAHALVNCTGGTETMDGEETAFLGLINAYRQQNGLGALVLSTNLNRAAAWMVNDLGTGGYFSHTDSLGRSPYQRAIDCGYPQGAGENLAAGTSWSTAQAAFDAWRASPGHNANMLGSFYQQIGIARQYTASSPYGWYWATNFGTTNDGTGGAPAPAATATPTNTPAATATATATLAPGATALPTATPSGSAPAAPTATPVPAAAPPPASAPGATGDGTLPPADSAPPPPKPTAVPATPTIAPTPPPPGSSLPLHPGVNLVTWPGNDVTPGEALGASSAEVTVIYGWDASTRTWTRHGASLPAWANNLRKLQRGQAYWFIAANAAALRFGE